MIDEVTGLMFVVSIFTFLLWSVLAFMPERRFKSGFYPSVSVVIPAHNEESCIESTVKSVLDSDYPGKMEVVVVNDGSSDGTGAVLSRISEGNLGLKVVDTDHVGKAVAVNAGVSRSKGEVIVLLDADSQVESDALKLLTQPFSDEKVGAVSGIISVVSNRNPLVWYQDFEYVLSSMWRYVFDKLNCTYILPGFAALRRQVLTEVGGFSGDILSEDFDIGLKIRKAGYGIVMSKAVMHTNVPQSLQGVARQRMRWGRGTVQVIRKHRDMLLNAKYGLIGLYGMPNQLYFFIQGFMIIPITLYQFFGGYLEYFALQRNYLTFDVVKYFFGWFSLFGTIEFVYNVLAGVWAMTPTFPLFLASWALNTFYNFVATAKMKRVTLKVAFAIVFFFPYFLFTLFFFSLPFLSEINPLKKIGGHVNIWEKNR